MLPVIKTSCSTPSLSSLASCTTVVDSDQFPVPLQTLHLCPAISNSLDFRKVCSETDLHRLGKQRVGRSNYGDSPANQNLRIKSMLVPDKQCSVRGAGEGRQEREVNVIVNPICIGSDGGFRRATGGNYDANSNSNNDTDSYYQKLLEADPGNPLLLSNYARFLHEVKHDMEKAKEYYARAMLSSPDDGDVSAMYANLIWLVGNDPQHAKIYFNRAMQAAPHDCYVLASHPHFLWNMEEEGWHIVTDSHEHFCDSTSRSVATAYC